MPNVTLLRRCVILFNISLSLKWPVRGIKLKERWGRYENSLVQVIGNIFPNRTFAKILKPKMKTEFA